MEKITPFDIPLLNNEVCRYLSLKDLARCVQVSKAWFDWFSPALWRDLDCHIRLPYVYVHTFARQQEHVRTMRNITMTQARSVFAQVPCTNLHRLDFMQNKYTIVRRSQLPVLRLLEKMPTLRHLQIVLALDLDSTCQSWIRALEAMPHLESLSLKCEESLKGWVIPRTLYLCHGLRCLSVRFMPRQRDIQEKDVREFSDAKAAIETMPEMQLRELSFDQSTMWEENIFQPLLERCPRLGRLDLPRRCTGILSKHLVKKLPALRHLSIGRTYLGLADSHIEVLSHIACGLESLDYDILDNNRVTQPLIKYHSHSLTRLVLHHSHIHFGPFVNLMVGLPCLQTFTVTIRETPNGNNDILLDKHWECLGMRSLQLDLNAWIYHATFGNECLESVEKPALNYMFSEIARLTSLRELRIRRSWMGLYAKSRGYLEQLAGLKQLEVLELSNTGLGRHEAQWMADNWPRLRQVYEYHVPTVFKETLRKRRPLVEFVKIPSNY